jgi:hypothetical protein
VSGLSLLGVGLVVLVWAFVDAFGEVLACAEGD